MEVTLKRLVTLTLTVFLVIAVLFAGCSAPAPATGNPIKIGACLAMTGSSSHPNTNMKYFMQSAVQDINDAGGVLGRPLELIIYDDELNAAKSATFTRKLITEDKVVALVGYATSATAAAAAPLANELKIPVVGLGMTDALAKPVTPYAFNFFCMNFYALRSMLERIKALGNTKIGLYYTDTAWGQGALSTLQQLMKLDDFKNMQLVTTQGTPLGQSEVSVQVMKLKDAGCQSVVVMNYDVETAAFYRSLNSMGWKPHTISVIGAIAAVMSILPANLIAGAELVDFFSLDGNPDAQAAVDRCKKRFPQFDDTQGFAYIGYDEVRVVAEAIKKAGSTDPGKIRDALETISDFPMVAAGMKGSKMGYSTTDHAGMTGGPVKQVQPDGKYKFLFGVPNVSGDLGFYK
jgi:branched-chain amino acid transport system substrate-binding protein